jgi:hypothetical protein
MFDESDSNRDTAKLARLLVELVRASPLPPLVRAQVAQIAAICALGDAMDWDRDMLQHFAETGAVENFRLCLTAALILDREIIGQPSTTH